MTWVPKPLAAVVLLSITARHSSAFQWSPRRGSRSSTTLGVVAPNVQLIISPPLASLSSNAFGMISPQTWNFREWLVAPANAAEKLPPTESEVTLLREALAALYGEKDAVKAEPLLSKVISAWERQNPDERAAIYRVQADCLMELAKPNEAAEAYDFAIRLLDGPGGNLADPSEIPAAHLGRARALRSAHPSSLTKQQATRAASDYQLHLKLTARGDAEDFDSDAERVTDGAGRNPYVAWEWAASLRSAGDFGAAADARSLAADSFDLIGDKARKTICDLDRGVDLAMAAAASQTPGDFDRAKTVLEKAIATTTDVDGSDLNLLQRVLNKEGEARMALASVSVSTDKPLAEEMVGKTCKRLGLLEGAREKAAKKPKDPTVLDTTASDLLLQKLGYSIDGGTGSDQITCSSFKDEAFVKERLVWPEALQTMLTTLGKSVKY